MYVALISNYGNSNILANLTNCLTNLLKTYEYAENISIYSTIK